MKTKKDVKFEQIDINKLKLYANNAKKHPKEQVEKIERSIKEFGFINPVIIDDENNVIAGHGRLEAAKKLGMTQVPTLLVNHLTTDQIKAYRLADNKLAESDWDDDILKIELEELKLDGFDISLAGFDDIEIDVENENDDIVPEIPKEPISKLGDVYQLGRHRLMCGDSTKPKDVEKLMEGEKADMVFTDPPYGINVVKKGKNSMGAGVICKGGNYRKIIGDDKPFNPTFLLPLSKTVLIWGANFFSDKLPTGQWIVWDKKRPEGVIYGDCELAWINKNQISIKKFECLWHGMIKEGENSKRMHPTQKPIKLCVDILSDFSKENEVILDLFLGSGSTLVACEKTGRICYGMELSPDYCDVIVQRYVDYTGKNDIVKNGEKVIWQR